MFRKRREQRKPHPDPRTEAELQRILSLRRAVARKEAAIERNHAEIKKLDTSMRRRPGNISYGNWVEQLGDLSEEASELEKEIPALHDEIAKRIAALSDTDLAYLEPWKD